MIKRDMQSSYVVSICSCPKYFFCGIEMVFTSVSLPGLFPLLVLVLPMPWTFHPNTSRRPHCPSASPQRAGPGVIVSSDRLRLATEVDSKKRTVGHEHVMMRFKGKLKGNPKGPGSVCQWAAKACPQSSILDWQFGSKDSMLKFSTTEPSQATQPP